MSTTTTDPVSRLMQRVRAVAGITLGEQKRELVEGRIAKRLRELGLDAAGYADLVDRDAAEQVALIDLLTTNHTAWLREPAHFADFAQRVLPQSAARAGRQRPSCRVWCAAAATGEEPWTIAMTMARTIDLEVWDCALLATDISTRALAKAKAGTYTPERVAALSDGERAAALARDGGAWRVRDELRALVHFARLNLMDEAWPMRGPFDAIFCRNVMIYFDSPTQERLVRRLSALLRPGGTLYVGHAESLSGLDHPLKAIAPAVYLRPA